MKYRAAVRFALVAGLLALSGCAVQEGHDATPGYFGEGQQPSFAEKHPGAPSLPAPRATFEQFARSVGLVVAGDVPGAPCIKQVTLRPPGPAPVACASVLNLKSQGNTSGSYVVTNEGYVVFYDGKGMAYAVMNHYEYTGL
jgi:hypothetical protein